MIKTILAKLLKEETFYAQEDWRSLSLREAFLKAIHLDSDWEVRALGLSTICQLLLSFHAAAELFALFSLADLLLTACNEESNRACRHLLSQQLLLVSASPPSDLPSLDPFFQQLSSMPLLAWQQASSPLSTYGSDLQVEWSLLESPPPAPGSRYHLDMDCF